MSESRIQTRDPQTKDAIYGLSTYVLACLNVPADSGHLTSHHRAELENPEALGVPGTGGLPVHVIQEGRGSLPKALIHLLTLRSKHSNLLL